MTAVYEHQFRRLIEGTVDIKRSIKFAKALHQIHLGKPQDGTDSVQEDHKLLKGQMKNLKAKVKVEQTIYRNFNQSKAPRDTFAAIKERVSVSMSIADKDLHLFNKRMKECGIYLIVKEVEKKLNVILSQYTMDISVLPHQMFSWAIEEVIFRCGLADTLYIDLIQYQFSENEVEKLKLKVDAKEIVNMMKTIWEEFKSGNNLEQNVMQTLIEYNAAADFEELLSEPMLKIQKERDELTLLTKSYGPGSMVVKHPGLAITASFLEMQHISIESMEPIRSRYIINWNRNVVAQIVFANQMKLDAIQKEINHLKHLYEEDTFGTKCSLNMYYVSIEQYKTKIDEWTEKYEADLESTENENAMLINSIQRANEDLRSYQDRCVEMQQKVADTLEKIAKEEEAALAPPQEDVPDKRKSSKIMIKKKKTKQI